MRQLAPASELPEPDPTPAYPRTAKTDREVINARKYTADVDALIVVREMPV